MGKNHGKNNGKEVPGKLEVVAGFAPFYTPLWWENSMWYSALQVAKAANSHSELQLEIKDSFM